MSGIEEMPDKTSDQAFDMRLEFFMIGVAFMRNYLKEKDAGLNCKFKIRNKS